MQYKTAPCTICGKEVSCGGAAFTSHYRMHVRAGKAVEYKQGKKLLFLRADQNITDTQPIAKLGDDPLPGQPKNVWVLPDLKTELAAVDPAAYFVTSGEAVKKAEKLVKDVYALATKCRAFRDKLKKARGIKKYLETARDDQGRLLIKGKDPRAPKVLGTDVAPEPEPEELEDDE